MMGCDEAEDSIEHYSSCRRIAAVAWSLLRLDRATTPGLRLETFLGMDSGMAPEMQARQHIFTAAVYNTHNQWRHSTALQALTSEEMQQALRQSLRYMIDGHAGAVQLVANAWLMG